MVSIQNNLTSLVANRSMVQNSRSLNQSMMRLATGTRVNKGSDDPAGMISSKQLEAALKAIEAESTSHQRTQQVARVADGALGEVSDLLNKAEALVVANANSSGLSEAEREANQLQIDSILNAVDHVASSASFNGEALLDGELELEVGTNGVTVGRVGTASIGEVARGGQSYQLDDLYSGRPGADSRALAQDVLRAARAEVNSMRSEIGGLVRDAESAVATLSVAYENTSAAVSTIADTDYAKESAELVRAEVMTYASRGALVRSQFLASHVIDLLS